MTRTRTALWTGLAWLTAAQALVQISPKRTDYEISKNATVHDANMTIGAISMDWIEVDFELDDVPVIEYSFIIRLFGSENEATPCPPMSSHHSERKTYSCKIEDLTPCTEYELRYYAIPMTDPVTEIYNSVIRGVQTTANETIPPGNLTCRTSVPGTLTVEWIDPFPEDCQASFEVSWEGHALWDEGLSESNNATVSESFYTLEVVIPEADYTLDVAVWFQGKYPGATASIVCTTLAEESSAPQNVSVTPSSYDITVKWEAPAQLNGVISHYDVMATWANGSMAANNSTEGPTSQAVLSGLVPCSRYQVTVAAVNGAGTGAGSDPEDATTLGDDDVNPNIQLTCFNGTRMVSVEWSEVLTNCSPSTYSLSYSAVVAWDESRNIPLKNASLEGVLAFQVPEEDYVPGAQYSFELSTGTRNGNCDVKSNDELSSPPAITVAETGISFIYLTWEPPAAANGVIDSYELQWSAEEEAIIIEAVEDHKNLTEGVFACAAYHVTLTPHNGAGLGEADTTDAETLRADLSNIKCDVASDSSLVVSWTVAPANCDRNGTILSWQGESQWDEYSSEDSTLLGEQVETSQLTDLYPFTLYNICVSLTEEWAEEACCDATTRQGVPTAPENVTTSSTYSSIWITWEQPESWNGIPLQYIVTCPSEHLTEAVNVSTPELTIDDLREGTYYSIEVQACNEEHCSSSLMMEVPTTAENHSDVGLIVGITLGFAAVIVLVIVFIVVRKRRRDQLGDQTESERVVPGTDMGSEGFSPGNILKKARAPSFSSSSSSSSSTSSSSASSGISVTKL